jgi:microcin C transport system permease protein
MPDQTSKDNIIPRDDLPREENPEKGEQAGPLDVPQMDAGEDHQELQDSMLARPSIPVRHIVPDTEVEGAQPAQRQIREAMGDPSATSSQEPGPKAKPVSILRKRWRKFKSLKRGYYSFLLLVALYAISFALPLIINNKALVVHYNGEYYFPVFTFHPATTFGQTGGGEMDYRLLDEQFEQQGGDNWALMPLYEWDPYEVDFAGAGEDQFPLDPSDRHWFGTDDTGRDIFARMCYGFNVSISFALLLTLIEYLIGGALGGLMGYFGGKFDLFSQRIVEIWSTIPFLYTVIIVSSILVPNFMILILVLSLFNWIGISYYMRGEFLREKGKDYVAAAIALGVSDRQIIFKHILPNALTPMIAYLPFTIVGGITSLVSLDYLGFGLPPPIPSWGQMVHVGLGEVESWWLTVVPLGAMFITLLLVTFIGESIREAFDPRVFSRLR